MSKFDKLIERIKRLDISLRFDELVKVLEAYGYTGKYPSGGSSHYTFRKDGHNSITIPSKKTIDIAYIKLVRDVVESEDKDDK